MGFFFELCKDFSEYLLPCVRVYCGEAFIGNDYVIISVKDSGKTDSA